MIDNSPPGSWRALDGRACALCRQNECDHPDAVYIGIIQVSGGGVSPDRLPMTDASGEAPCQPAGVVLSVPFHANPTSQPERRNHG